MFRRDRCPKREVRCTQNPSKKKKTILRYGKGQQNDIVKSGYRCKQTSHRVVKGGPQSRITGLFSFKSRIT